MIKNSSRNTLFIESHRRCKGDNGDSMNGLMRADEKTKVLVVTDGCPTPLSFGVAVWQLSGCLYINLGGTAE